MIRKLTTVLAFVFLAVGLLAPAASAYTMDEGGYGFVGKGEVQTAFGWNNKQLQANAETLQFTYISTDSYEAICSFTTGEGTRGEKTHNVEHKKSTSVTDQVTYDARTMKQVTGFTLLGFGATTESGTVPVVDQPCMGNNGHEGVWTSVNLIGSTGGGLYVSDGAQTFLLP